MSARVPPPGAPRDGFRPFGEHPDSPAGPGAAADSRRGNRFSSPCRSVGPVLRPGSVPGHRSCSETDACGIPRRGSCKWGWCRTPLGGRGAMTPPGPWSAGRCGNSGGGTPGGRGGFSTALFSSRRMIRTPGVIWRLRSQEQAAAFTKRIDSEGRQSIAALRKPHFTSTLPRFTRRPACAPGPARSACAAGRRSSSGLEIRLRVGGKIPGPFFYFTDLGIDRPMGDC